MCLKFYFCCSNKIPCDKGLGEKGFILSHPSKIQSLTAEKSQKQEPEAAGHITALVVSRKELINAFFSPEKGASIFKLGLLTSIDLIRTTTHGEAHRPT